MLPLLRFRDLLIAQKEQFNLDMDELIMGAELVGARPNYLVVDEHGFYHVQASGTSEEVIAALEAQLQKLKKIRDLKDKT